MSMQQGFDNDRYVEEQSAEILKRVERYNNRLYLEFGGKLLFDYHAARVLPGYDPNVKIRLLQNLKEQTDLLLCIHAGAIERKKIRADFGITYESDTLKLIDDIRDRGIDVLGVVITRFKDQPSAKVFRNKLERRDIAVYTHAFTKGYPTDIDLIVSDQGYGANSYIESEKPLVVITGPGPGSGKLATCLSQLYHDHRSGTLKSGYAKFETFPIWNLPLKHPVNIAYEAATADLRDFNLIDPFHLEAYGKKSVNYNRDVDAFPLLKRILEKITGEESVYQSPTDMGVNRAGFAIIDDKVTREAAKQELIRRFFRYSCEYVLGFVDQETVNRAELLLKDNGLDPEDRPVVEPARIAARRAEELNKGDEGIFCGAAIELKDGATITGNNSPLLHAAASVVIHAIKHLAGVPGSIKLLPGEVLDQVSRLKTGILKEKSVSLDLEEALIALSVSANANPQVRQAMEKLGELRGCEAHMTHIPRPGDEAGLRSLGINLTSDPNFSTRDLFIS
ncbi:DUF1846 domain-containing protein [Candidatus Zixiibacteriota bacterium]